MRSFHGGPSDRKGYHHGNLKEALVEAARRFIAERGLGGFTLVEAARLAGVTPAALYRHFSGRDALVSEVAGRGFTLLAERLGRAVRGGGTPLERFTRMGEAYLAFAEEEPGFYAAMFAPRSTEEQGFGVWGPPPGGQGCAAPERRLRAAHRGADAHLSGRVSAGSTRASSPSRSGRSRTASPRSTPPASCRKVRACRTNTSFSAPASSPSCRAPAPARSTSNLSLRPKRRRSKESDPSAREMSDPLPSAPLRRG